jgi:hypothetical protein
MISTQVARAEASIQMATTHVATRSGRLATASPKRVAGKVINTTVSLRQAWDRIPTYTLPTAAGILLVASAMGLLNPLSSASRAVAVPPSPSDTAATAAEAAPARPPRTNGTRRAAAPKPAPASDATAPPATDTVPSEPVATGATETADAPVADATTTAPGALTVFSRVPLEILAGDRRIGSSEDEITLPPGRHQLRLVNTRLGYQTDITVDIKSSAVTTHAAALPDGQVQVVAPAGSEIWIEGRLAGVAPIGVMTVPIGTRAIEVKHPLYGDERGFVEVRYGGVSEISIDPRDALRRRSTDFPLPSLTQPGPTIR